MAGLVAGLATICLLSLPAAANTTNLDFINLGTVPGDLTVYDENGTAVTSIPLPGLPCSTSPTTSTNISTTLAGTATGTISVTFTNHCTGFVLNSNQFCAYLSGTFTGTYAATHTYASASSGVVTVVLRKNVGATHDCHSVTTTTCTLSVSGVTVAGPISTVSPLPTLLSSDVVTMGGSSVVGTLLVSGTAASCNWFIAANNGSVSINARTHVVH